MESNDGEGPLRQGTLMGKIIPKTDRVPPLRPLRVHAFDPIEVKPPLISALNAELSEIQSREFLKRVNLLNHYSCKRGPNRNVLQILANEATCFLLFAPMSSCNWKNDLENRPPRTGYPAACQM